MIATIASIVVAIAVGAQVGWSVGRDAVAANASHPVSACVKGSQVFVLASGRRCTHGVILTWNRGGKRGKRGVVGAQGPVGATGPTGNKGPQGSTGPAGVVGSKLENAAGLSCNSHAGTITVQFDSTTGLERFVCQ